MRTGVVIACLLFAAAAALHWNASRRGVRETSQEFRAVACACLAAVVLMEAAGFWLLQRGGYAARGLGWPVWGAAIGSLIGVAAFGALAVTAYRMRQPEEGIGAQFFGCCALAIAPLLGACCGVLFGLLP